MILGDIDVLDFTTYVGSCSIYLVMAICLLFIKVVSSVTIPAYEHARRLLAYCALFGVLTDAGNICAQLNGINRLLLDCFYIPVLFYMQLYLMCFSLLSLIRSRWTIKWQRFYFLLPMAVLTLAYTGYYLASEGLCLDEQHYVRFIHTSGAKVLSTLLYVIIIANVCICICVMRQEAQLFRRKIENYFSNRQVLKGMRLNYIVYTFIGYLVLTTVDFLLANARVNLVLTLANIVLFVSLVIVIFNIQALFTQISVAVDFLRDAHVTINKDSMAYGCTTATTDDNSVGTCDTSKEDENIGHDSNNVGCSGDIGDMVSQWVEQTSKPYMKEGITLASTAQEIGIHARLLSHYINDVYEVNFNTWINRLRIQELCRILDANQHITMADLAQKAGFTDASAMSKVFRREVGISPSQYRAKKVKG